PEFFAKAMASDAESISFDLEDAVDESRKDSARGELARFLKTLPPNHGKIIVVRVNSLATPHGRADLEAIVGPWLDLVNQPKCEGPEDILRFVEALATAESQISEFGFRNSDFSGLTNPKSEIRIPKSEKKIGVLVNIETPRALRLA